MSGFLTQAAAGSLTVIAAFWIQDVFRSRRKRRRDPRG